MDPDGAAAGGREDGDEREDSRSKVSTETIYPPATEERHWTTPRASVESKSKESRDRDDQEKKQTVVLEGAQVYQVQATKRQADKPCLLLLLLLFLLP